MAGMAEDRPLVRSSLWVGGGRDLPLDHVRVRPEAEIGATELAAGKRPLDRAVKYASAQSLWLHEMRLPSKTRPRINPITPAQNPARYPPQARFASAAR